MNSVHLEFKVDEEYILEWITSISTPKIDTFFKDGATEFVAISYEVVDLIIKMCNRLELGPTILFTCIDAVDKFFANHFKELHTTVKAQCDGTANTATQLWSGLTSLVDRQCQLRIWTVLSVVAKYCEGNTPITVLTVQSILQKNNQYYDTKTLLNAEFRVLRTLGFIVPPPVAFDTIMLILLGCSIKFNMDLGTAKDLSIEILKLVYLQRDELYQRNLVEILKQSTSKEKLTEIKSDKVLLGSAVVVCTTRAMEHSLQCKMIAFIVKLSRCNKSHLTALAKAIFNLTNVGCN